MDVSFHFFGIQIKFGVTGSFFFFLRHLIYLFMTALCLPCFAWAFSSCGKCGLLFIAEHVFQACGLRSCGTRAQLLHGMWNLPGPGIEPMSLASAGRFLSTVPSGKSWIAGSYGKCSYSFIRNCHTIYQDGYTFYKRSSFSTSLPAVVVITVFYYGPPNNCIARPHCGFNLHLPDG